MLGRQTSALNRNQIKQAPTNPLKVMKTEVFLFFFFLLLFLIYFFIIKSQRMKKKGTGNQRGESQSVLTQRSWSLKPLISGHVHWDCLGCNDINQFVLTNVGGIMKTRGCVQELEASQESRDFSFSRSLSLSMCVCVFLLPHGRPSFFFFISLVRARQFHRRHEQIKVKTAWTESISVSALPGEDVLICPLGAWCHAWFQQLWSEQMSHVGQRWIQRYHPYKLWEENPGHHHPQGDTPQFSHTLKLSHCPLFHPGGITLIHWLISLFIYLCVRYL